MSKRQKTDIMALLTRVPVKEAQAKSYSYSVTVHSPTSTKSNTQGGLEGGEVEAPKNKRSKKAQAKKSTVEDLVSDLLSGQKMQSTPEKKKAPRKKACKKGIQEISPDVEEMAEIDVGSTADNTNDAPQQDDGSEQQTSQVGYDPDNQLGTFEEFCELLGSWKDPLQEVTDENYFKCMFEYMKEEYEEGQIVPHKDLIFNAYQQIPINGVKVVILGQEPYSQPGYANGLCYSVGESCNRIPQTLKQIYLALEKDNEIDFARPDPIHGDLTAWAQQGVLLLNEILTVRVTLKEKRQDQPKKSKFVVGTHKRKGWENFTRDTLIQLNQQCNNVVYMAWGKKAQGMIEGIIDTDKNLVIHERHPSLQVVARDGRQFQDTKCFSEANEYLQQNDREPIDWNL